MRLGAIGLVTDGGVRDVDTVREMGFHYFAPGMVPAHGNFGFMEAQVPVRISGVLVNPGDLIHADANGVVTIPKRDCAGCRYRRQRRAGTREGEP